METSSAVQTYQTKPFYHDVDSIKHAVVDDADACEALIAMTGDGSFGDEILHNLAVSVVASMELMAEDIIEITGGSIGNENIKRVIAAVMHAAVTGVA